MRYLDYDRHTSYKQAEKTVEQTVYLHYYTDTVDYFICGYDGEDTMYGTARSSVFPDGTERQKISLANFEEKRVYET